MRTLNPSLRRITESRIALRALVLLWATLALPSPAEAQQYREITRLGTSQALCKPINSAAELQAFFADSRDVVLEILADANWQGDPQALFDAVAAGDFTERGFAPGTELLWMGRQVKGKPDASPFVRWAGRNPFDAFTLEVTSNGQKSTFVIPKVCCNLSLLAIEDAPPLAPLAAAPAVVEQPPAAAEKRFWPLLAPFIGFENRTRDLCNCIHEETDPLLGAAGGVLIPLGAAKGAQLLLQAGGAVNLDETTFSSTFIDIGMDFDVGERGFLGGGVGIWSLNDHVYRDGNVFLHGGADTNWKPANTTTQWFVEGRVLFDEDDVPDISTDYVILGGLRFVWK